MEQIPEMMFAAGEEPVGVRVLTYQSSRAIKRITRGLDEAEVLAIRSSSFGKIIDIGEKPAFSGRFARYLMSRQLKVKKKHEVWFRFAGQPIRFSLREFAIVTGLPCGKYPPKSKMKIKETIAEKPYWPSLFGKVEVVTVSSVIKMLRRRTVTDRETRIKFACLAILSSVLLPTNLNMKIAREHAEAIENLDDFYSYPWGRLAYEMLMSSIKDRDEITLSQGTIAMKGFALALQLVVVEAVPSLTEVVQETCSSSESDSADEADDGTERSSRKQTLSPAHARNVDKRTDVTVKSIIDEDQTRPLDECSLVWSDDEEDELVDNMVKRIKEGNKFDAYMFKGGASKADVQRMREEAKARAKEKKPRKAAVSTPVIDGGNCEPASTLIGMIKPELQRIDGNVSSTMRAVSELSTQVGVLQCTIKTEVQEWMGKIKDEIEGQVASAIQTALGASTLNPANTVVTPSVGRKTGCVGDGDNQFYENTIRNVMGSIGEYSTPPRQHVQNQDETVADVRDNNGPVTNANVDRHSNNNAQSASSHTQTSKDGADKRKVTENASLEESEDAPSFSLGLTQKENSPCNEQLGGDRLGRQLIDENDEGAEIVGGRNLCRKSKRQKIFPSNLMADYECGHGKVSHGRETPELVFVSAGGEDTMAKYKKLEEEIQKSFVFNVDGLTVTDKDIKDIGERSRLLPAKAMDIVNRILRTVQNIHTDAEGSKRDEFFDTKFAASLSRNYSKFAKCKNKEGHVFPKGTLDFLCNIKDSICMIRRFYLPFNFDKKHWVGVCVDCEEWKIYVLDCNTSIKSDKDIVKDLTPISEAFPYLLKQACGSAYEESLDPMVIERVKGIGQNKEAGYSGMAAMVLMWNHSIGGVDRSRSVNVDHVSMAAKGAAVMAYELHAELK